MIRFVSVIRCHIRVFKYDLKGPLYQILGHVSKCPNARGTLGVQDRTYNVFVCKGRTNNVSKHKDNTNQKNKLDSIITPNNRGGGGVDMA